MRLIVQHRKRLLREGIAALARGQGPIEFVATAETGAEVERAFAEDSFDVAVLELHAEEWDVGLLISHLTNVADDICTVVLHDGRRSDEARHAQRVGATAQVSYGGGAGALFDVILDEERGSLAPVDDRRTLPSRQLLTPRERDVLVHIAGGLTTIESALALSVSPKTIDNHKQRIFMKLGVQNQAHAVALAHRMGIMRPLDQRRSG
jgi:DNA-binding NarL/FixJ family response regulator